MNERYLFRGKQVDSGEWVTGGLKWEEKSSRAAIHPPGYMLFLSVSIEVDPATVGQCTGLKDKNGSLIFEGDILDENGHPFVVVYETEWAKFTLKHGRVYQYPEWNRGVRMGIIGNIHDNPELLSGGSE